MKKQSGHHNKDIVKLATGSAVSRKNGSQSNITQETRVSEATDLHVAAKPTAVAEIPPLTAMFDNLSDNTDRIAVIADSNDENIVMPVDTEISGNADDPLIEHYCNCEDHCYN